MKKIFSFLFIISFFYTATAQQIVNRAGPANTVQDQRLAANLNFILPRFTDTTAANASLGLDLCGAQIYTTNNNTIWYRQCLPKRWIKIMSEITGNCGLTFGGLVTGAGSGLTLDVTSAQYCIANSSYYYPGGNITLSPADPLYDRFDALALDNTGALIKITGTPAPNPAIPTINPATQVFLTAVQVKAGSGSLGATQFLIWDENTGAPTEWADGSTSTYNPDATILPVHGSKHIIFNNPANNNNIRFTGTPVNSVDYNTLKFFIKLSAPLSNFRNFTVLINTSGNLPNTLTLTQAYGFNKNDTNYQNITIPLADFNAGTCTIDAVIIRYTETSDEPTAYPGFYLDYLTFNGGTSTPPVLGGYLTNVYKVTGSDSVYKTINGINSFAFIDNTTDTAAIIMAEKVNDTTVRYCRRSGYCFYVTITDVPGSDNNFATASSTNTGDSNIVHNLSNKNVTINNFKKFELTPANLVTEKIVDYDNVSYGDQGDAKLIIVPSPYADSAQYIYYDTMTVTLSLQYANPDFINNTQGVDSLWTVKYAPTEGDYPSPRIYLTTYYPGAYAVDAAGNLVNDFVDQYGTHFSFADMMNNGYLAPSTTGNCLKSFIFTNTSTGQVVINNLPEIPYDSVKNILVLDSMGVVKKAANNALTSVQAGSNIDVDNTDPRNPVISAILPSPPTPHIFGRNGTTIYSSTFSSTGNYNNNNFFVGDSTGNGATGAYQSNFIGKNAGNRATNAYWSNFLGLDAGANATYASISNFLGISAGANATYASLSNFFGNNAGTSATNANYSNFLGNQSGSNATNANYSNFIGSLSGYYATNAANSNFLGKYAGQNAVNASYSNLFGFQTGQSFPLDTIGSNNIIIGTNISLPNLAANSINIGGVLFGTGTNYDISGYPKIVPAVSGKIGIRVVTPTDVLDVAGNVSLVNAGNKIKIATGSNASVGTATLAAGTVTVNTTAVSSSSKIFVTVVSPSGTQGFLSVPTITDATSFVINSTSATETSTVNWWIVN